LAVGCCPKDLGIVRKTVLPDLGAQCLVAYAPKLVF